MPPSPSSPSSPSRPPSPPPSRPPPRGAPLAASCSVLGASSVLGAHCSRGLLRVKCGLLLTWPSAQGLLGPGVLLALPRGLSWSIAAVAGRDACAVACALGAWPSARAAGASGGGGESAVRLFGPFGTCSRCFTPSQPVQRLGHVGARCRDLWRVGSGIGAQYRDLHVLGSTPIAGIDTAGIGPAGIKQFRHVK